MDPKTAEDNLGIIRSMGCRSIHVGGGEPLLRPDDLVEVLEAAKRSGVSVEYVETNSSWFKNIDEATKILSKLRKKGVRTLLVSISPFHNEHIPFSRVKGVIDACKKTDINVFPWVNGFIKDLSEFNANRTHSLETFKKRFGQDYLYSILKRYWIHLGGRALDTFRPVLLNRSAQEIIAENPGGCGPELSDTSHFHFDLFGNYIPGLCSGFSISAEDLNKPISPKEYPLITMLVHSGIRGMYQLACKEFGFLPGRSGYINKCDLCTEIRNFLVHITSEDLPELQPREFYRNRKLQIYA